MSSNITIVTDSTSDIPADIAAKRQIYITPLHIIWGDQNLRDGIDISRREFYERLATDAIHPSTSQPTPGEFADIFQQAKDETRADAVVAITLSADLSGTFAAAQQAARMVDFPVTVVDSRTTSGALGLHVLAVADVRDSGAPAAEVIRQAQAFASQTRAILTIDTLTYMHRSGRVSGARRWMGTLLQIKPIVQVENGKMEALEGARGTKNARTRMLEIFNSWIDSSKPVHIAILHSNEPSVADDYEARLIERWNPARIMKVIASSAVGVHTGPGAIGLTLFQ